MYLISEDTPKKLIFTPIVRLQQAYINPNPFKFIQYLLIFTIISVKIVFDCLIVDMEFYRVVKTASLRAIGCEWVFSIK